MNFEIHYGFDTMIQSFNGDNDGTNKKQSGPIW